MQCGSQGEMQTCSTLLTGRLRVSAAHRDLVSARLLKKCPFKTLHHLKHEGNLGVRGMTEQAYHEQFNIYRFFGLMT